MGYNEVVKTKPISTIPIDSLEYYRDVKLYQGKCTLPDSSYIRLSEIKIKGNSESTQNSLMEELRAEARHVGANAVIEIDVRSKTRNEINGAGILLDLLLKTENTGSNYYEATVIKGVAVYIKEMDNYEVPTKEDLIPPVDSTKN